MYNYNILSTSDRAVCTTTSYCPRRTVLYVQLQYTVHVGPCCVYNYNILSTSDRAVCTTTTYCPRRTMLYVQLQYTVHVGPCCTRRRHDILRKVLLCPQTARLDEVPCSLLTHTDAVPVTEQPSRGPTSGACSAGHCCFPSAVTVRTIT